MTATTATIASPGQRHSPPPIQLANSMLSFDKRCYLMGIVNTTPDSFSDGGRFVEHATALEHALQLIEAGADIIDIGGESTRPGAQSVSLAEELERTIPLIQALRAQSNITISIDTYKAEVARQALKAGADIVNDISALSFDPNMASVIAHSGAPVVLMHIRKTPADMQHDIHYDDLIQDLLTYFRQRIAAAEAAGIRREQIIIDPGIGFGKTTAQNYQLIRELGRFLELDRPILLGTSRKNFLGQIIHKPAEERAWATAATVACGIWAGAHIVRVHDVAQIHDVLRVTEAIIGLNQP